MTHLLFSTMHGSHLYGTSRPESDLDEVHVFLPAGRDLLLGRVPGYERTGLGCADEVRPESRAEAEDRVYAPFHRVIEKVLVGEPNAIELLFAPSQFWLCEPDPIWLKLVANRHRLVTRNFSRYASFAFDQARHYGVTPRNYEAALAAKAFFLDLTQRFPPQAKLAAAAAEIETFFAEKDFHGALGFEDVSNHAQGTVVRHVQICGRRYEMTARIDYVAKLVDAIADQYGRRTKDLMKAGVNWKALSTAMRISDQALELMATGKITFPRPRSDYLRDIKSGIGCDVATVVAEIEATLALAQQAADKSPLPLEPDRAFADELLIEAHLQAIHRDPELAARFKAADAA